MQQIQTAKICNIGNEILNGKVCNTNSHFLSQKLENNYIQVIEQISILDKKDSIIEILRKYCDTKSLIILTGGLGPTSDDKTVEAVCKFLDRNFVYDAYAQRKLNILLKKRKYQYNDETTRKVIQRQTRVPESSISLKNVKGIAPGFWVPEYFLLCLPGFPLEIKGIWDFFEKQYLKKLCFSFFYKKNYFLWGIGESGFMSSIQENVGDSIFKEKLDFDIAIHALPYGISVYCKTRFKEKPQTLCNLEKTIEDCYRFYNVENPMLSVLDYCKQHQYTLSAAESCTGGLIGKMITDIPDVSSIFLGCIVSYSDIVKQNILGVSKEIIRKYGAVSLECSVAMVENATNLLLSDITIATTGIAGPKGQTKDKPVGLVYIAITNKKANEIIVGEFHFPYGRERFRQAVAYTAFLAIYQKYVLKLSIVDWETKALGKYFQVHYQSSTS